MDIRVQIYKTHTKKKGGHMPTLTQICLQST